jgi:cysteine desulfuration protein SufE
MNNYPERLRDLLETISLLPDDERVNFLIDYAGKFKEVPPQIASKPYPENKKVPFCESGAYVWTIKRPDNKLQFYFSVENPQGISAKALAAILDKTLSGEDPEKIINISEDIISKIFGQNLSTRKNMGLSGIISMIKRDVKNFLNAS